MYIVDLIEAHLRRPQEIGAKAWHLGLLLQAGFRTPDGFCVSSNAYIHSHGGNVDDELKDEIVQAYRRLGGGPVAVRSSGVDEDSESASFAGQGETILNISSEVALIEAIEGCWASMQSTRISAYRAARQVRTSMALAVLVQRMVEADCAGVLFSVDPTGRTPGVMVVESSLGLGEAVVSGHILPDRFLIQRDTGQIVSQQVALPPSAKQRGGRDLHASLTPDQLKQLHKTALEVEELFGKPQDIEWAFQDGELFVLQARPITRLPARRQRAEKFATDQLVVEEIERLSRESAGKDMVWSNFNMGEVLPAPLPFSWSIARRAMSDEGFLGQMYRDLGFVPKGIPAGESSIDLICGRTYINLNRMAQLFFGDLPLTYDTNKIKADPRLASHQVDSRLIRFDRSKATPAFWLKLPYYLFKLLSLWPRIARLQSTSDREWLDRVIPELNALVQQEKLLDISALTDSDLLQKLSRWMDLIDKYGRYGVRMGLLGVSAHMRLQAALIKSFGQEEGRAAATRLTAGYSTTTFEANLAMWKIAQGELSLDDFLAEYGHRAILELELAVPRWEEDPSFVIKMVELFRRYPELDPQRKKREALEQATRFEESILARLRREHPFRLRRVRKYLAIAKRYFPYREDAKFEILKGFRFIRQALLEIGRRTGLGDGVFYLNPNELESSLKGKDLSGIVAERRLKREALLEVPLPDVIFSDRLNELGETTKIREADFLTGDGISAGGAEGPCWVVTDPGEPPPFVPYVLVIKSADPGWTPLFLGASGLVMGVGGILSHAAVVAREYGVPAVANIPGLLDVLHTGQIVRVQGDQGRVEILGQD